MSLAIDLMHLLIVVAGVGIGAWALIGLRRRLRRGRFVIFGIAASAALFGCAALGGEVGFVPPAAWFAVVFGSLLAAVVVGLRLGNRTPGTA